MHQIFFCLLAFSFGAAQLNIRRSCRARRCPALRIGLAVGIHNAEIVLCVLVKIFGCDPVTACRRLTCERDIAFKDLVRVATDLYVRTVAVKRLNSMRHSRTVVVLVIPIVATARAFVWSWSHDTCLIAVDVIGHLSGRSIPLAPLGWWALPLRITRTPSPERRQPRRDRSAFQPFSVFACDAAADARSCIERYPQDPSRSRPRPSCYPS